MTNQKSNQQIQQTSILFIILSPKVSESNLIKKSMTLAKIKSIMNRTIDGDIILSNFTITSSFQGKSNSTNDNIIIYIFSSIGGFLLCSIVITLIFRKKNYPDKSKLIPQKFDSSSYRYCEVCSQAHLYL